MNGQPPGYQRLFAELKRRKVFRVAAVYGATGFVLVQAADLVFRGLGVPSWALTLTVVLVLLGFPIALVLAWAFETTPEGVRRTEAAAPDEVEHIVAQPASERWPAGVLALMGIALLVAGAWWVGRQSGPAVAGEAGAPDSVAASAPAPASIAVLPFADMSPEGDQEHFSDGIAEELLNLLARVPELRVAARTSSFAFEDDDLPIPVIADSLNVAHVLEGSVRKAGAEVRITAQLIRAEDGYHLWSESWDRTLDDVFAIQDEIAAEVVDRLRVTLLDETPTVEETDPEAYALVLRAHHLQEQGGVENLERSERLYREALAIDSTYAAGWTGLARTHYLQARVTGRYSEFLTEVREATERALAIDPERPRAHTMVGLLAGLEGDLAAAARHYERALAEAPGDAWIVGRAGVLLMMLDRPGEAVEVLEHHVDRDPVNASARINLGLAYYAGARWQEAIESFRTAHELAPDAAGPQAFLGQSLIHAGRPEAGLAAIQEENVEIWRLLGQAMAYHALGRTTASDSALTQLIEGYERQAAFNIANVLAYRGEIDRAFRWLDKAVAYDDPGLAEIFVFPEFEALEDDPRWDDFLERIGKSPDELDAIELEVELPGERARAAAES